MFLIPPGKENPGPGRLYNETVDYLAIAITNLVSSFDPELIVLGGGYPNPRTC